MGRVVGNVALALFIGFVSYRVALVALPSEPPAGSSVATICAEGNVPRGLFNPGKVLPDVEPIHGVSAERELEAVGR